MDAALVNAFRYGWNLAYDVGRREQKEADAAIAAAKYDELSELRSRPYVSAQGFIRLEIAGKFVNEVEQAIRKQGE
jgi:hypothetical protein